MSQSSKIRRGHAGKRLAAAIVMGLSVAGSTLAHGQHPATPCPCAADGMCYPKRDTWGFYKTNWRAAPGESMGPAPTRADGGTPEVREQLPNFIRPLPEDEDLRGPARPVRQAAPGEQAPAAGAGGQQPPQGQGQQPAQDQGQQPAQGQGQQPAEEAPPALPDGLELPGFGPQGSLEPDSLNPLPRLEEGPPALPSALSKSLTSLPQQPAAQYATVAANRATAVPPVTSNVPVANSRYVSPVSAEKIGNIELANPAAKNVQKTMDQDLHHAIYFEASDLSQGLK